MSKIFLQNVRLMDDPARKTKPAMQHIAIRDGIITAVGPDITPEKGARVLDCKGAMATPGWMDLGVQTADPGFEHREDLHSTALAAASGGFTAIACMPNTKPAIHSKAEVLYIRNKTAGEAVRFFPIGSISQEGAGKDLAELYDMFAAGAVAFSDGHYPVQDAGLLLRALQYTQAFGGLVMNQPYHKTLAGGGQMHEGVQSTMLGMKGIPGLAEEITVQRDLKLLEYSGGRLHVHLVSTTDSVAMIRAAKAAGMQVSCSVAVANLAFTDQALANFDTNYKVKPPLRTEADRVALIEGLLDGTIDCICSNHEPWDTEAKNLEFPYAEFGMSSLDTAFSLSHTILKDQLSLGTLVEKWALGPRHILGLPLPRIVAGEMAEITVFDPAATWTVQATDIRSKSKNTPLIGQTLQGRVLGIVGNGQAIWNA
jgi:dihydroorotase